jgi:hypothetical protein
LIRLQRLSFIRHCPTRLSFFPFHQFVPSSSLLRYVSWKSASLSALSLSPHCLEVIYSYAARVRWSDAGVPVGVATMEASVGGDRAAERLTIKTNFGRGLLENMREDHFNIN